jgi:site-specific DNA-methyltransferase (adenine-specific)
MQNRSHAVTALDRVTLHRGDCLDVLGQLAPDSFHACITDPPYHFGSIVKRWSKTGGADRAESRVGAFQRHSRGFMGQTWDGGDIAFRPETWAAVLRVLKPGAHLVAFGAPKNVHRLTCAIEDAGFEIRDCLMWLFGQGFPKSHDAEKALGKASDVDLFREHAGDVADKWAGYGSALKPAYEPIILARKPLAGTIQENLREHETGAINIDACRVHAPDAVGGSYTVKRLNPGASVNATGDWKQDVPFTGEMKPGRFPANVLHDGSDEVVAEFPDTKSGALTPAHTDRGKDAGTLGAFAGRAINQTFGGDTGSAARFFYCAKATKADRAGSKHPTVKPIALMRYLCRLVTPPGGLILDPFAGTGTTGQAAVLEGFSAVLIEREPTYQEDIVRRLSDAPLDLPRAHSPELAGGAT